MIAIFASFISVKNTERKLYDPEGSVKRYSGQLF
jgi:hypothetical protein